MERTPQDTEKHSPIFKSSEPHDKPLEIHREFAVPVAKLFAAFTDAEILKAWWWPKDLYADRIDLDFRVGGRYFINMKGYDAGGGGMTGEFQAIVPNKRIVMTDHFADKEGRPISAKEAKMAGDWPEVILITFEFESTDAKSSQLHLSQQGIPIEMQNDCMQGWTQQFDKLDNYLRSH